MVRTVVAVAVMLLALADLVAARQAPSRVVVRAGKLLDVKTGKTLANQAIVIEGDKIVSMGAMPDLKASARDNVIDLSRATVLPGLTDAHTHLTFDPKNIGYERLAISVPREALIGARNAPVTLEARLYHRPQCGSQRLHRCGVARCYQCRRHSRSAQAGQRPPSGYHRGTL